MVEVDKVLRDLTMLHQSFKISKFYRVLMSADEDMDLN